MKQSDVDKKLAGKPVAKKLVENDRGQVVAKKVPYRPAKKKSNARPPKGYIWERVAVTFGGHVVTPKIISGRYKVDRAYACRVLQSMIKKGLASYSLNRGEYEIWTVPVK